MKRIKSQAFGSQERREQMGEEIDRAERDELGTPEKELDGIRGLIEVRSRITHPHLPGIVADVQFDASGQVIAARIHNRFQERTPPGQIPVLRITCGHLDLDEFGDLVITLGQFIKSLRPQRQRGGRPQIETTEFEMAVYNRVESRADWYPTQYDKFDKGAGYRPTVENALNHLITKFWPEVSSLEEDMEHLQELREIYERVRKRVSRTN